MPHTRAPHRIRLMLGLVFLFVGWGAACTENPTGTAVPTVVVVTPSTRAMDAFGSTVDLEAVAKDVGGETLDISFTWSSSAEGVARVDGDGRVTAVSEGTAIITAAVGSVAGSAEVIVDQRVAQVVVDPADVLFTTAGATQQFTATATDANGHPVADASYHWTSADHTVATVDGSGLATTRASGVAVIGATAGSVTGYASLLVDQQANRLVFLTNPMSTTAGDAIDPAIRIAVQDAAGNRIASADTTITLAIGTNPANGVLSGTRTVGTVDGVATFTGLWIERAAAGYTLSASATGIGSATSVPFDITAGEVAGIEFAATPADSVTAGTSLGVAVAIVDEFGNTVPSASDTVTLSLAEWPGMGHLVGDTVVPTIDGVARFDSLTIHVAGPGYVLAATAGRSATGPTEPFVVRPAAAHFLQLASSGAPSTFASAPFEDLAFMVTDTFFNLVADATPQVTISILTSEFPGASADGVLTVTAEDGVARFDSLSINKPGLYSLLASSTDLAGGNEIVSAHVLLFPAGLLIPGGAAHTCISTSAGGEPLLEPFCWGSNASGQLGAPTATAAGDSVAVAIESGLVADHISVGDNHTCTVDLDQIAYCWGANASGQLGDGNAGVDQGSPVQVATTTTLRFIVAGGEHSCGLGTDSLAYCWGANDQGQLGTGTAGSGSGVPVLVTDSIPFIGLTAGADHTCGLGTDSLAYCWGDNVDGQLGDGNLGVDSPSPVTVTGGHVFLVLDAGARHTCGVDLNGSVRCWGANESGQVDGGTTDAPEPVLATTIAPVFLNSFFTQLAAGGTHTCVIKGPGEGLWCWGDNASGQLGRGTMGGTGTPAVVENSALLEWIGIGSGSSHTCAFAFDDNGLLDVDAGGGLGEGLHCWGANGSGQLGDGSTTSSSTLSRVIQGF